jgi:DNA repair exonuclease SbcCD ATPase subunit
MNKTTDTPRTDALMVNGCIAINILEHARTLERELNNMPPPPSPSGDVWPEIVRLKGKIAELQQQKHNCIEIIDDDVLERVELKAEVERLRSQLTRAVSIAGVLLADIEDFLEGDSDDDWTRNGWNDSRISKSLLEKLIEEMTTDTPRTDSAEPQLHSNKGGWVRADFARELERELAASQAEVEELQQQKRNCIEIIDDDTIEKSELKAEVERLKKQLKNYTRSIETL